MAETANSQGLRVASFESRRAVETARLLQTAGASPYVSPAMREVPLQENQPVLEFARSLIAGDFDVVVFMTGVGFRLIRRAIEGHVDEAAFAAALGRVMTVARGPKPVAAMQEIGLTPSVKIGEPNTWRDILTACRDETPNVRGLRVAIQEHGLPSSELKAGLEALGAIVSSVPVYQWALPEDVVPLQENLHRLVDGQIDVALFTSSRQVVHVLLIAGQMGIEEPLRAAFSHLVVGSIGPTTSETLREHGLDVDFEPRHPKLGHLVVECVAAAPALLRTKQLTTSCSDS